MLVSRRRERRGVNYVDIGKSLRKHQKSLARLPWKQSLYTVSYFSAQTGNKVYFKPENMQYTGAYKVRGAYYKNQHSDRGKKNQKVLITASAAIMHRVLPMLQSLPGFPLPLFAYNNSSDEG